MASMKYLFIALFTELFLLPGCKRVLKSNNTAIVADTLEPFNYNRRNVYFFSVKATRTDNTLLYADTLGLMCLNKLWNTDSFQKTISWLYVIKAGYGAGGYVLNPAKVNNTSTGMESTNEELFLHPPREDQYTILEICPFPYLHFPLQLGKKCNWDLDVGGRRYSPSDSIMWTGDKHFKMVYEVTDATTIEVPAGKIPCYKIHAVSTSDLGKSLADFYYSYRLGRVKLHYEPQDHTIIELNFLSASDDLALFKNRYPYMEFGGEDLGYLDHKTTLN